VALLPRPSVPTPPQCSPELVSDNKAILAAAAAAAAVTAAFLPVVAGGTCVMLLAWCSAGADVVRV
jgi:hypothetical protein